MYVLMYYVIKDRWVKELILMVVISLEKVKKISQGFGWW